MKCIKRILTVSLTIGMVSGYYSWLGLRTGDGLLDPENQQVKKK